MKIKQTFILFALVSTVAIVLLFQNCGQVASNPIPESGTAVLNSSNVVVGSDVTTTNTYVSKAQVNPLVANRVLMTNIFTSIFGPAITPVAANNMGKNSTDFGSGFSVYDRVISANCAKDRDAYVLCATGDSMNFNVESNISLNIRREAWRVRTCHTAINSSTALLFALRKISSGATLTKPPSVTEENLNTAFRLFFRSKPLPDVQLLDSLAIVAAQEDNEKNKWQSVLLALCLSPHWQVL
jgi:hypothetical protein